MKHNVNIGLRDLIEGFLFSLRPEGKSNGTIEYYTYLLYPLLSYAGEQGWADSIASLDSHRLREFLTWTVTRTYELKVDNNGGRVEKAVAEDKEHRRRRTLPIDEDTLEMLKEYVDRGGPVGTNGKQLLFGLSRGRAWQIIKECAGRAGLGQLVNPETGEVRGVSPHRLRDAFAVHAAKLDDSGDGLRFLQEQLGHVSFLKEMGRKTQNR